MEVSRGPVLEVIGVEYILTAEELSKLDDLQKILNDIPQKHIVSLPVQNGIAAIADNELQLVKFLRGRKLNVERAAASIQRYAEYRFHKSPELFPAQVPDSVRRVFGSRILNFLRHRDHLGRVVLTFTTEPWDTSLISFEDIGIAGRCWVDALLNHVPETMTTGIVVVHDFKGASLSHAKQYSPSLLKKFVDLFLTTYPLPFKGVYIAHTPLFVKLLNSIMKPFMSRKLNERVHFTSSDKELFKLISPKILPKSLGGVLSEEEAYLSVEELQTSLKLFG